MKYSSFYPMIWSRRHRGIGARSAVLYGTGLGVALMYLLDLEQGKRRRAAIRDKLVNIVNRLRATSDKTLHTIRDRAVGLLEKGHTTGSEEETGGSQKQRGEASARGGSDGSGGEQRNREAGSGERSVSQGA